MKYDFDQAVPREGTGSVKYDRRHAVFGREDVIPLWVADTDFATPPEITSALVKRAEHPTYGYTFDQESTHRSMIDWYARRHGFHIDRSSILLAPGVVPSIHAAIMALTEPGDGVIIQTPVYAPFFKIGSATGRRLIENPLRPEGDHYSMDLEHLSACADDGAKMLVLCSPHNPVGRVWTSDELKAVIDLARAKDLIVISDEIHCDLVLPGNRHTMTAAVAEKADRVITLLAPSKSFNIPGMGLSSIVADDAEQRRAIADVFAMLHIEQGNPFSFTAYEAAYTHGDEWIDQMMEYVSANRQLVSDRIAALDCGVRVMPSEGTYLQWLDCTALAKVQGWDDAALKQFWIQQAGLGLNPGISFGSQGSGFMRMNLGTTRALLKQALDQLATAVSRLS